SKASCAVPLDLVSPYEIHGSCAISWQGALPVGISCAQSAGMSDVWSASLFIQPNEKRMASRQRKIITITAEPLPQRNKRFMHPLPEEDRARALQRSFWQSSLRFPKRSRSGGLRWIDASPIRVWSRDSAR